MEKVEQAYKDYKKGMKYKDIATKYGVSLNTVKSWKQRRWADMEKGVQPKKSMHTKRTLIKKMDAPPIEELMPEEIETLCNEDLTEKQRLFCLYYTKWFNATKAYQKAYDCDYNTAMVRGCELLRNVKIKEHIQAIKNAKIKQSMYNAEDLFQKMMAIAYADITDFLEFGQEDISTDKERIHMVNNIKFKESYEVDGTLIQEVKQGKDGASIKLISKEFALKWLDKNYGVATEEQRARIELLKVQKDKLNKDSDIGNGEQLKKVDMILKDIQDYAKR